MGPDPNAWACANIARGREAGKPLHLVPACERSGKFKKRRGPTVFILSALSQPAPLAAGENHRLHAQLTLAFLQSRAFVIGQIIIPTVCGLCGTSGSRSRVVSQFEIIRGL